MPAKAKKQPEKSKKEEKKLKEKIIEDKTFGLKNKNKSASVQKYIKGVQQQVKGVPKGGEAARIAAQIQSKEEKKKTQADQLLLASLFKAVVDMPKDQDPKTIICSFYKSGFCQKGAKCKFSHDLSAEPVKQEKPDMYTDKREVVSEVICQFFLEAVESEKFGWFWKCPNGDECIYRHALPLDYVFKNEEVKVVDDDEEKITLEEEIDTEKNKVIGLKPVTFEEFMSWVAENNLIREEQKNESRKHLKGLTGRALFEKDSGLFQDDDDAYEGYDREEQLLEEELDPDQRMLFENEESKDEQEREYLLRQEIKENNEINEIKEENEEEEGNEENEENEEKKNETTDLEQKENESNLSPIEQEIKIHNEIEKTEENKEIPQNLEEETNPKDLKPDSSVQNINN